jgi:hypothetical protein
MTMNQADRASVASVASIMLWVGVSLGCRPPPIDTPVAAPITPVVATTEPAACHGGLRFADYEWVPDDARMTTSIQRDDPALPAALTTLARMTEAPEVTLPSFASLDFRNLPLQLGNLDRVLDEFGDDPAELIELHSPAGELVWLWPSDCPPALVAARVLDRWQIMLRADLEHPGVRYGAGSADGFPFDVLTVATTAGGQRVALTRVGHGAQIGAWLREAPRGGERGPGRSLAELDAAPVRSVLGDASSLTTITHHRVRVTSDGWDDGADAE